MGLLATLDRSIKNASYIDREGWFADWLRGNDRDEASDSGISITPKNGIQLSTVYKCVNWRANQFGMLPKKINERVQMFGRMAQQPAPTHPLYRIVHTNPNPMITAKAYFGIVSADLHLWGNSYAYIERGANTGRLRNLWRFRPDMVRIEQDKDTGALTYCISNGGPEEKFPSYEVLHIRGLGFDGIQGYSPIHLMRNLLGWNAATTRYGAQFFKNASRPSGLISLPAGATMKKEVKDALLENLSKSGREAGKLLLIEGALEYKPLTMPQDDAQFIETTEHQEEDIIGVMGVPQHKVQVLRRSTNNNIEQQGIEAVTDCLQPLCCEVEQWMNLQLLSGDPSSGRGGGTERDRYFMECELKALLRGDTKAQTDHVVAMIQTGVYSQNMALDYLGETPFAGGEDHWMNLAYGTMDEIKKLLATKSEPEPDANDPNEPAEPPEPPANVLQREIVARFSKAYGRIFRDTVGRVASKGKLTEREKSAIASFRAPFEGLAEGLQVKLDDDFTERYLCSLSKRAATWGDAAGWDRITRDELDRAIKAILGGGDDN